MMWSSFFIILAFVDSVSFPVNDLEGVALTNHIEERIHRQGATPLLENNVLHFLYKANPGEKPRIDGDFNFWSRGKDEMGIPMTHLGEGWYHFGLQVKPQTRLEYVIRVGEVNHPDPRNPNRVEGWNEPVSVVEMPDYPSHPELERREQIAKGAVTSFRFKSDIRRNEREVHIYTPANYRPKQENYPVLYFGDGNLYVDKGNVPQVLDNLIANKTIPPVIAVFIDPVDRWLEYRMSTLYRMMVLKELIPYVKARWAIDESQQIVIGGSRGGMGALDLVLTHPDRFSGCVAIAPAVTGTDFRAQLQRMQVDKRPRFSVLIGNYDFWESSGLEVVDLMEKKGYRVEHKIMPIGHTINAWVGFLDDLLPPVLIND